MSRYAYESYADLCAHPFKFILLLSSCYLIVAPASRLKAVSYNRLDTKLSLIHIQMCIRDSTHTACMQLCRIKKGCFNKTFSFGDCCYSSTDTILYIVTRDSLFSCVQARTVYLCLQSTDEINGRVEYLNNSL